MDQQQIDKADFLIKCANGMNQEITSLTFIGDNPVLSFGPNLKQQQNEEQKMNPAERQREGNPLRQQEGGDQARGDDQGGVLPPRGQNLQPQNVIQIGQDNGVEMENEQDAGRMLVEEEQKGEEMNFKQQRLFYDPEDQNEKSFVNLFSEEIPQKEGKYFLQYKVTNVHQKIFIGIASINLDNTDKRADLWALEDTGFLYHNNEEEKDGQYCYQFLKDTSIKIIFSRTKEQSKVEFINESQINYKKCSIDL